MQYRPTPVGRSRASCVRFIPRQSAYKCYSINQHSPCRRTLHLLPQQALHSPTAHCFEVAPQLTIANTIPVHHRAMLFLASVQKKQSCRANLSTLATFSLIILVSHKAPTSPPPDLITGKCPALCFDVADECPL